MPGTWRAREDPEGSGGRVKGAQAFRFVLAQQADYEYISILKVVK